MCEKHEKIGYVNIFIKTETLPKEMLILKFYLKKGISKNQCYLNLIILYPPRDVYKRKIKYAESVFMIISWSGVKLSLFLVHN